jgi:hypothetical protein
VDWGPPSFSRVPILSWSCSDMARKMKVSYFNSRAYGSYDGLTWFALNGVHGAPFPERYYRPDLKYEKGGRKQAIKDLRECFS